MSILNCMCILWNHPRYLSPLLAEQSILTPTHTHLLSNQNTNFDKLHFSLVNSLKKPENAREKSLWHSNLFEPIFPSKNL